MNAYSLQKKQIGIYSGSFNPLHVGHLILANYMLEFTYLEEIWLLVTPHNPLKDADELIDDKLRLEMAQLAVQDYPGIKISDFEMHMPTPSYTCDTFASLTQKNPNIEFTLIIGSDNWVEFPKWKNSNEMIEKYKILIYPRLGEDAFIDANISNTVKIVDAPMVEISSTYIRNNIKEGKDMRAFVPPQVYQYIKQNRLYSSK